MPESDDFATELRGDGEEMNVKQGGFGQAIMAGLVVAIGTIGVNRLYDHTSETTTAATLAELKAQVANLSTQLSKLTDQPYVRRDEFENRISGLERRVDQVEQRSNSHR